MTGSALYKACALALLAVVLFALPAPAKLMVPTDVSGVSIILDGGWELPGLTVRWSDPDGGLWAVRPDGARRLYKPQEMVGLRDTLGRDITRDIMPDWAVQSLAITPGGLPPVQPPTQSQPQSQPQSRPAYQPPAGEVGGLPAKEPQKTNRDDGKPSNVWHFLLGADAGWGIPHEGDFLGSDGGLAVDVRARLLLGGPIYLAGGYTWQSLAPSTDPYPVDNMQPGMESRYQVEDGLLQGVWAGLSLMSPGKTGDTARFYLEGGVGRFQVDNMPVVSTEDAFLGYHGAAGFMIPLGPAVALDLGARVTHIMNLDLGVGDDQHTLLGFRLGLSILAR